jgi:hypothetical protein
VYNGDHGGLRFIGDMSWGKIDAFGRMFSKNGKAKWVAYSSQDRRFIKELGVQFGGDGSIISFTGDVSDFC